MFVVRYRYVFWLGVLDLIDNLLLIVLFDSMKRHHKHWKISFCSHFTNSNLERQINQRWCHCLFSSKEDNGPMWVYTMHLLCVCCITVTNCTRQCTVQFYRDRFQADIVLSRNSWISNLKSNSENTKHYLNFKYNRYNIIPTTH